MQAAVAATTAQGVPPPAPPPPPAPFRQRTCISLGNALLCTAAGQRGTVCPHNGGRRGHQHLARLGRTPCPAPVVGGVARTAALHPRAGPRGRVGHLRWLAGLAFRAPMRREGSGKKK